MRHDKHVLQDVSLTLRLSGDLDRGMRESAEFFGRSLGAEWRVAAHIYRRVLNLWSTTVTGSGDDASSMERGDAARKKLLLQLCDGLVREPRSLDALRNELEKTDRTR